MSHPFVRVGAPIGQWTRVERGRSPGHRDETSPSSGSAPIRLRHMSEPGIDALAGADPEVLAELRRLRDSIDNLDAALVHVLAERFRCTQQVGVLKAANQMPPADPAREARQIARL